MSLASITYRAVTGALVLMLGACQADAPIQPEPDPPVDSQALVLDLIDQSATLIDQAIDPWVGGTGAPEAQSLVVVGKTLAAAVDTAQTIAGVTFVLTPSGDGYVPDATRTGAPVDGVRFVLYAVDGTGGTPEIPLREIGYAEVNGLSGFPAATLAVDWVIGGVTSVAYRVGGLLPVPPITPCCSSDVGVLLGPRDLLVTSVHGTITTATSSTLADTVRWNGDTQDMFLAQARVVSATLTDGAISLSGFYNASFRFLDSDRTVRARIAIPTGDNGDSTVIRVTGSGVRGFIGIDTVWVEGDASLVSPGSCVDDTGQSYSCLTWHNADSVPEAAPLRRFRQTLTKHGDMLSTVGWGSLRAMEAFVAPATIAIRWLAQATP